MLTAKRQEELYGICTGLYEVSVISPYLSRKLQVANSAITGIGAGTVLFGFALSGLIRYMLA
ncbi:hypothetical protein [Paenibacillus oceani]|uniref:Uncharacterized protein n=1 Tax=Paenibacillus oceani TaxID=2772510 RepID=A0A927CI38_9BACL|nr:hypothetical protein [Paenibacillus oceani]MBD2866601.1 hypothetical protein [Paenibacillus oceani]